MTRRCRSGRAHGAGFTLIEVLAVLVLFSIGLLGLVALQTRTTRHVVDAEDNSRAVLLANDLAATMWGANSVNLSSSVITAWQASIPASGARGLPNGSGSVSVSGNIATITVQWRAPNEASDVSHRYVTQVLIP